jgi:lipopolysaccharide cholinephosphotransferase
MSTKKISRAESNSLYRTLKFIHDTFVKRKISYWITGGNLLGGIRHGGLIPWDDDGDICMMKSDVPKLKKLIPYFEKHNYVLEKVLDEGKDDCLQVKNSCDWFVSEKRPNSLGLDIFIMKITGEKITYANPYWETAQTGGKKCYFLKKFVFPLVPIRYGNFYLYIPNNPVEHLNRCYGTNWNSKSRMLFNHRTGEWIESKPKKMESKEYEHPRAPKETCDPKPPPVMCPVPYLGKLPRKSPVNSRKK